jgi:hypothetical protein
MPRYPVGGCVRCIPPSLVDDLQPICCCRLKGAGSPPVPASQCMVCYSLLEDCLPTHPCSCLWTFPSLPSLASLLLA